jgi:hypothetical protein
MSRQTIRVDAKITRIVRLKNTTNGNPRYRIVFCDRGGVVRIGFTKPDAGFTYEIYAEMVGGQYIVKGLCLKSSIKITDISMIDA